MESLQATVDELNRGRDAPVETQRELLTRAALGHEATVACRAGTRGADEPEPQYALFGNEQQEHCCVRDDTVTLFCDVEGGFQPTTARATWVMTSAADPAAAAPVAETETANGADADAATAAPAPPPDADARIDGTRLAFDFACSAVRCGLPARLGTGTASRGHGHGHRCGRGRLARRLVDGDRRGRPDAATARLHRGGSRRPRRLPAPDTGPPPLSGSAMTLFDPVVLLVFAFQVAIFWRCRVLARADESEELDLLWNTFKHDIQVGRNAVTARLGALHGRGRPGPRATGRPHADLGDGGPRRRHRGHNGRPRVPALGVAHLRARCADSLRTRPPGQSHRRAEQPRDHALAVPALRSRLRTGSERFPAGAADLQRRERTPGAVRGRGADQLGEAFSWKPCAASRKRSHNWTGASSTWASRPRRSRSR